jgi:signal transduction histidine kinase
MLDAPRSSLRGRSFSSLVSSASDGAGAIPLDDLATGTRDRYEAEGRFVRDDGALFWGHVTVSPHSGPGDAEVIVMIEDVSSRKAYEEQLRDAKQKAEEASRLKSALLANMSHEIRTPLTSIIGFAGVLADNLSGSNARYARLAHQSGQRLMDTLNSVLQLSKLEAGVVDLDTERMDLVAEVRQTLDLYRPQAKTAAVDLQFAPSVDTLHGQWAPTAVRRILSNLLSNALKFTPSGGTVTVRIDRADSAVVLEVEDTGIGIDDDFRPRAFDAFTQESQGLQREHEGSGLGLSIVQRLVDLLGGTIELESTKGEGTRACVQLPHDA